MRWEYKTLVLSAKGFFVGGEIDVQRLEWELNSLGREGWECVGMTSTNKSAGQTRDLIVLLKRPAGG